MSISCKSVKQVSSGRDTIIQARNVSPRSLPDTALNMSTIANCQLVSSELLHSIFHRVCYERGAWHRKEYVMKFHE